MKRFERHFLKHRLHLRHQSSKAKRLVRETQSKRDRHLAAEAVARVIEQRQTDDKDSRIAVHECRCSSPCELCVCVTPHAAVAEVDAEAERVLADGNAREHLAVEAKTHKCQECEAVPLSFWQRLQLWLAKLIAPLCSYREGGANCRPTVKQE